MTHKNKGKLLCWAVPPPALVKPMTFQKDGSLGMGWCKHPRVEEMKFHSRNDDAAANALARRWKLKIKDCIAETRRARIFQVDSPDGPAALKLYKRIGSSGESASVPFLRDLAPGAGAKIYRVSPLRTAVLMEFLEGPTLQDLVTQGEEARATALLADVAAAVIGSSFRFPIIYSRQIPAITSDFALRKGHQGNVPLQDAMHRAANLFDHLVRTSPAEQVIHGDLGYGNVILTSDGPKLIDPKGLRADPACEFAKALSQPYDDVNVDVCTKTAVRRASLIAAKADVPMIRIVQWATINLARTTIKRADRQNGERDLLPYLTALLALSDQD